MCGRYPQAQGLSGSPQGCLAVHPGLADDEGAIEHARQEEPMATTRLPLTTRLFGTALCVAAAALGIATGPIASARAEDNGDTDLSQEEACAYLEDGYERASQYASEARANGDMAIYNYFQNLAQEIYLDAQFDWECDWAAARRPPKPHLLDSVAGAPLTADIGLAADDGQSIKPPRFAVKSAVGYERWLDSNDHRAACRTMKSTSRSLDGAQATQVGDVVEVAAHFGECTWAAHRLPLLTAPPSPTPEAPPAGTETTPPPPAEEEPPPPPVLL